MRLPLAVNYSAQAAALLRSSRIRADRFKCPAWLDTIDAARRMLPVYVHMPLTVGSGSGHVIDAETQRPANLDRIERILERTDTPLLNLHIASPSSRTTATQRSLQEIRSRDAVVQRLVADVGSAVKRFGADRVALENDFESMGDGVAWAIYPETVAAVLGETGAGLILDLSHAQIASRRTGVGVRQYVEALPIARLREMHVSGVRPLAGRWADRLRGAGIEDSAIADYLARSVDGLSDHLPLTAGDWALTRWAVSRLQAGAWRRPWIVAFEYGGVGGWFAPVTEKSMLARQIRRLCSMLGEDRLSR